MTSRSSRTSSFELAGTLVNVSITAKEGKLLELLVALLTLVDRKQLVLLDGRLTQAIVNAE